MYLLMEMLAAIIALSPGFLLLCKIRFRGFKRSAGCFIFAVYLAAVYQLTGLPTITFTRFEINLNLIPFIGMIEDIKTAMLNVLLFVPLGFILPLLWTKYRHMKNTLCFGFCMTTAIELLQLFTYRATDVDDMLTNLLGTMLGYVAFRVLDKLSQKPIRSNESTKDIWFMIATVVFAMYFVQPLIISCIFAVI